MPVPLTSVAAIVLLVTEVLAIAIVGGSRVGARVAVAISIVGLGIPFFVSGSPLARTVLAAGFLMCFFRSLEVRDVRLAGFRMRLLHLGVLLDMRRFGRSAPALNAQGALVAVASLSLTVLALWFTVAARGSLVLSAIALGIAILASFEFLDSTVQFAGGVAGWGLPRVSKKAHVSTSLAEFWGTRWNVVIGGVLREHVFAPRARTPGLALALAFVASAAAHFYLIVPGIGTTPALLMAGFFLAQPMLIAVEREIGIRRWSPAARRLWTFGMLGLVFPLFAGPALRLIGVR